MTTETINTQVVTVDDTHINILTIGTQGPSGSGGSGSIDHGTLTGLGDDDHTQYHTDARGDARYSPLGHTHTASQIVDFDEAVEDKIGTKLVAGSNITVTYNDTTGETTVAASASGYTDEQAQDAVGTILTDTTTIDFTYDDAGNAISAQLPYNIMDMLSLTSVFYLSGSYYDAGGADGTAYSTVAQVANRMELHPIVFNDNFETDQLAINVATGVASSLSK